MPWAALACFVGLRAYQGLHATARCVLAHGREQGQARRTGRPEGDMVELHAEGTIQGPTSCMSMYACGAPLTTASGFCLCKSA